LPNLGFTTGLAWTIKKNRKTYKKVFYKLSNLQSSEGKQIRETYKKVFYKLSNLQSLEGKQIPGVFFKFLYLALKLLF